MFQDLKKNITFSKSFLNDFDRCARAAVLKKVERPFIQQPTPLLIGMESHSLFAQKIAKYSGLEVKERELHPTPAIAYASMKAVENVNPEKLIGDGEVIGIEESISASVAGRTLSGRMDLVVRRSGEIGDYVHVIDFKGSFKVKTEIDSEELIYAYLGMKLYDAPVMFTRFSGQTGMTYNSPLYFPEEIPLLEKVLLPYLEEVEAALESNEIPLPKVNDNCPTCPFKEKCAVAPVEATLAELLAQKEQQAQEVKETTAAISRMLDSSRGAAKARNGMVVRAKTSKSWGIMPGQKIKKKDAEIAFLEAGLHLDYPEQVSVKFTEASTKDITKVSKILFRESVRVSTEIVSKDEFLLDVMSSGLSEKEANDNYEALITLPEGEWTPNEDAEDE